MRSSVAIDRLLQQQLKRDPKLRKLAAGRPTRASAKPLADQELLDKLRSLGIELDRASLEAMCAEALSAEEIVRRLSHQDLPKGKHLCRHSDWLWIGVDALWQRWFPHQPSFESLDDKIEAGYERLRSGGAAAACRIWLEAWREVLALCERGEIRTIAGFDKRFRGTHTLLDWIQDLKSELWNAGLKDRQFLADRIAMCEEALRRFPSAAGFMIEAWRRALAESYFERGETETAESLFGDWLAADPRWGGGWLGWAECYFSSRKQKNLGRCEEILRQGSTVADVKGRGYLTDLLVRVCDLQGRHGEAAAIRRQEPGGSPQRRPAQLREPAAPPPPPVTRQKVGRNEPCPCGSGKKHKKCCGA